MAYDKEQRDLLKKFWEDNEIIITAAIDVLSKDADIDADQRALFDELNKTIGRKNRLPNMKFSEMGITIGDEIIFQRDNNIRAIVKTDKTVLYNGEEKALSPLTKELLKAPNSVRGVDYWDYRGKPLRALYDKTYN